MPKNLLSICVNFALATQLYKPTKTAFSQVFRLFILISRKFFVRGVQRFYQFEVKKSPTAFLSTG